MCVYLDMGMCCKSKQTATDKPILPPPLIWCETPQQLKVHQNTITLCLFQTRLLSLLCPCSNPFVNMWSLNGVKGQGKEGSEVMTLSCRRSQGLLKKPNKKKMGEWKSKNLFSNLITLKIERNCSCCLGFFFFKPTRFRTTIDAITLFHVDALKCDFIFMSLHFLQHKRVTRTKEKDASVRGGFASCQMCWNFQVFRSRWISGHNKRASWRTSRRRLRSSTNDRRLFPQLQIYI